MKSFLFTERIFLAHKLDSSWQINEGAACMSIYIMNPTTVTISFPFLPPLLYLPLLPSTTCCPGKRFRCHWSSSWSSSSTLPSWPVYVTCATSPSPPSPWMLERSESTATEKFLEVCWYSALMRWNSLKFIIVCTTHITDYWNCEGEVEGPCKPGRGCCAGLGSWPASRVARENNPFPGASDTTFVQYLSWFAVLDLLIFFWWQSSLQICLAYGTLHLLLAHEQIVSFVEVCFGRANYCV